MPQQTGSRSKSIQSIAIVAVMTGGLIGSLALAYALTVARQEPWLIRDDAQVRTKPVTIGNLQLDLPESFELTDHLQPTETLDTAAVFIDRIASKRKLLIGRARTLQPRTPVAVLNQMLNVLLTDEARKNVQPWQRVEHFRSNTLTGSYYAGLHRTPAGVRIHLATVLTEDGRRYWVIYMSHLIGQPALVTEAMTVDRRLMALVVGHAVNKELRDAQLSDFLTVGLGSSDRRNSSSAPADWLPTQLRARIAANSRGEEPILLVPLDALAKVRVIRIRGVIDMGGEAPTHPLWPATLLAQQFTDLLGRAPQGQELWTGQVAGVPTWCVSFMSSRGALVRQVWYARLGNGRGVLLEVLSEPKSLTRATKWIRPLIKGAKALVNGSHEPPLPEWDLESAITNGRLVAQGQLATFGQQTAPTQTYYLIEENGRLVGYQLEQTLAAHDNDALALNGSTRIIRDLNNKQLQIDQRWRASADGSRFWLTTRWVARNPDQENTTLSAEQMQLQDRALSLKRRRPDGTAEERWSVRVPNAFVPPMAEEAWPINALSQWSGQAALVWMTRSRHQPRPYWACLTKPRRRANEMEPPTDRANQLLLRPAMSLDADVLTYNDDGLVLSYASTRLAGWGRGSAITAKRVNLDQAIKAFPSLEFQTEP